MRKVWIQFRDCWFLSSSWCCCDVILNSLQYVPRHFSFSFTNSLFLWEKELGLDQDRLSNEVQWSMQLVQSVEKGGKPMLPMQSTTNMNGYHAIVAKWWEQAHEIALFSTSECKYMPAQVQEKMHTAPNHGESCKHFQAGFRHIRCIC